MALHYPASVYWTESVHASALNGHSYQPDGLRHCAIAPLPVNTMDCIVNLDRPQRVKTAPRAHRTAVQ